MNTGRRIRNALLGLLGIAGVSHPAAAAIVNLSGTSFDVEYDNSQSALQLFGNPALTGDNILFSGNNFFAQSANGQGLVTNGGSFTLYLLPHANMSVTGLSVFAFGDYRLQGASSYVQVSGSLVADDANSADPLRAATRSIYVTSPTPVAGQIRSPLNNQNANWQAYAGMMSGSNPWLASTSRLAVTVSSTLYAYTDAADPVPSFAFIQEKLFVQQPAVSISVNSDPLVVPLPAALPLILGGGSMLGAAAIRPRRRNEPKDRRETEQ